jgi:hypothetical protein
LLVEEPVEPRLAPGHVAFLQRNIDFTPCHALGGGAQFQEPEQYARLSLVK